MCAGAEGVVCAFGVEHVCSCLRWYHVSRICSMYAAAAGGGAGRQLGEGITCLRNCSMLAAAWRVHSCHAASAQQLARGVKA